MPLSAEMRVSRAQRSAIAVRCRPGTVAITSVIRPRISGASFRFATCCAASGEHGLCWTAQTLQIHLSNSPVFLRRISQRSAARIFEQAPGPPAVLLAARPSKKTEGARDARGPDGPTGLDASRHRGLSKSFKCRKSAKSQGVPRAVFLRLASRRPRWADHFYPPLRALGALTPPVPSDRLPGSRAFATWTAGPCNRISDCEGIPRPPLPAPRLETLIRHPSVTRAGYVTYIFL